MGILSWLVVGLIAGFLASRVMRGGGYGLVGDIIVGIVGAPSHTNSIEFDYDSQ